MKILIADDHAIVRRGLRQIVSDQPDMIVVGESESIAQTMTAMQKDSWDVLVLDLTMPDGNGFDALWELRQKYPNVGILVLSMHSEDQFALPVLQAGAAGYLTKETAPEELVRAIRRVYRGGKYISQALAEKLAGIVGNDDDREEHEKLSAREFQVFFMIANGKTAKEIARELELSVKTVSTYRSRVLDKLGLHSNAEIVRYAIRRRIID